MYVTIRQKLQANMHLHPCVISEKDAIYRAIITMARFQQHNISILWTERGFLVLQKAVLLNSEVSSNPF